jgi:2-polyprenyl-3-methyl-5-hydroxy-6-metoxy-1,4-benzoquinol methylase
MTAQYSQSDELVHALEFKNRTKSFVRALRKLRTIWTELSFDNQKVLDIGCAEGAFLNACHQLGLNALGVEPSSELVAWGVKHHELRIVQGDYQSFGYDDAPYDIITLWDVIEHVASPSHLLEKISRVTKNGGLIVINTPIIDSWQAKVLSRYWPFLLNVHTFYYTKKTLVQHCEKFGLYLIEHHKYSQTLSIGYLLSRFGIPFSLSRIFFEIPLRYGLGQQTFLFRKLPRE